jgi:L-threonylcarbamoyladenylate synthase
LASAFWPGPLTLVVSKRAEVPPGVTAGLDTVAVRVPSHPVAHALLRAARIPIAAPSANRSTEVSPTTGSHVERSLGASVDLILDAGPTQVGIESTVVDVSVDPPVVLRPGMIAREDIARVVGALGDSQRGAGNEARRSPGMLDRHYAPRATLLLVDAGRARDVLAQMQAAGKRVGAILRGSTMLSARKDLTVELPDDPARFAAGLYAALHRLDDARAEVIVVERPPDTSQWHAVLDRLERAAQKTL